MTVAESYQRCREVARSRARNFYYAFQLLPKAEKDAMCAIYAFMRRADDLSDDPDRPLAERRTALNGWRTALEHARAGDAAADPILPAFAHAVRRYRIPHDYFEELLKGVESDLEPQRYRTFDELYGYCYRVASVVGMTTVHIFGFDHAEALTLAEKCGIGFQLTNILRDIPEDASMGRVYLPEEDLVRFGLSPEALLAAGAEGPPPGGAGFTAMMEFEWKRARGYYEDAAPLVRMVHAKGRPALWGLMTIYHGVLERIRRQGYDVYRTRARLSTAEKLWVLARASRARFLGGELSFLNR